MNGAEFYDMYEADNYDLTVDKINKKIGNRKTFTIFCSASDYVPYIYKTIGYDIGNKIVRSGGVVIDGHASTGIMNEVARGAYDADPNAHIGITTSWMKDIEPWYDENPDMVCSDIGERIQKIVNITDVAIIMPGGLGSLTEFFYILTEKCLGRYSGDIILCNFGGYYDHIVQQIYDSIHYTNTMREGTTDKFIEVNTSDDLFYYLEDIYGINYEA